MILQKWDKYKDIGLLVLRLGIGVMFMLHGYPKLIGGEEKWFKVGSAMDNLGISYGLVFWGFMAAFAEFFGGILLAIGLFFRPACIILLITMIVAFVKHIAAGDSFGPSSHSLESAILFFSLLFIGSGRYSVDYWLSKKRTS